MLHHIKLAEGSLGEEMIWVVRRMEIDYKAPARMDDLILIETRVSEIRGARVIMAQKITCEGRLFRSTGGSCDDNQRRPSAPHSDEWRNAFTGN